MSDDKTSQRRKKGSWRKFIPYIIVGALAVAIISALMPKPLKVEVAEVTRGPLAVSVFEEGKTRIRHRYMITPPIAGYLNRVELRAGAPIKAGETVLASIQAEISGFLDPRARAQAEARVSGAETLKMQRQAEVERAKSALDLAQKDFERAESLVKDGVISRQEFDNSKNRADLLEREKRAAEFTLRTAEFEIQQAQAALMQAETPAGQQSQAIKIVAPIDGFVLNVYEESARVVAPGTQIMEVGDPRDLEAEIELLSSDAVGVAPGAEVSIEQWGGAAPLRGKVSLVEPGGFTKVSALGVEEQRVRVRVDFLDPLPAGAVLGDRYRVEARIITWRADDVLLVPTGALFRRGGDWMAFVARDGQARQQTVAINHNNGILAEVIDGLAAGDKVIIHPPDTVVEGRKVVH